VHAGEEDHTRPGWTTLRRGQDSPWNSQWRKYVYGVANPWIEDGQRTEQCSFMGLWLADYCSLCLHYDGV